MSQLARKLSLAPRTLADRIRERNITSEFALVMGNKPPSPLWRAEDLPALRRALCGQRTPIA
jgi:hypothetical protein